MNPCETLQSKQKYYTNDCIILKQNTNIKILFHLRNSKLFVKYSFTLKKKAL